MKNKHIIVKYISEYRTESDSGENEITLPIYSSRRVVATKVVRFTNNLHLLAKLQRCDRLLLDYILEEMDEEDNFISNSKGLRSRFIRNILAWSGIVYSDKTVQNGFSSLKKLGILLQYGEGRGDYFVNPIYFYNGSQDDRKKLIAKHLKHQSLKS